MNSEKAMTNEVVGELEQPNAMCSTGEKRDVEVGGEKGDADRDGELHRVNNEEADKTQDNKECEIDSNTNTTTVTPKEIKENIGFDSEDVQDGFKRWLGKAGLFGCAGSKSKLMNEDEEQETYGFDDIQKRKETVVGRLKRRLSDRVSRKGRRSEKEKKHPRSRSHDDRNRSPLTGRQSSYKEAVNKDNEFVPLNNTTSISKEAQRVPQLHVVSSPSGSRFEEPGRSYPCQTNVQSFPSTIYRKRDQPIVDPDVYNFTHPERGYLVNIVNDRFHRQSYREGAHWDLLKMNEIGKKYGFQLFNKSFDRNLTRNQTLSLLTRIQQTDHSNCDCFMFMISTHGFEQPNPQLGGKLDHALVCADDKLIFTSTILKMLNDTHCPTLKGKPKIFFIQACRGEELDHGSDVFVVYPRAVDRTDVTVTPGERKGTLQKKESVDEFDTQPGRDSWARQRGMAHVPYTENPGNPNTRPSNQSTQPKPSTSSQEPPYFYAPKTTQFAPTAAIINNYTVQKVPFSPTVGASELRPFPIVDTPTLRCSDDMVVMYAIPQGKFAWRSQSDGSWMIDYLHQILMSHNMKAPKNFLSLLTKVSAVMALRKTNVPSSPNLHQKKAIPVIEYMLEKDIIFQPKSTGSSFVRQFQQWSL